MILNIIQDNLASSIEFAIIKCKYKKYIYEFHMVFSTFFDDHGFLQTILRKLGWIMLKIKVFSNQFTFLVLLFTMHLIL